MSVEQARVKSNYDEAQSRNVNYNLDRRQQFCVEIPNLLAKNRPHLPLESQHVQGPYI